MVPTFLLAQNHPHRCLSKIEKQFLYNLPVTARHESNNVLSIIMVPLYMMINCINTMVTIALLLYESLVLFILDLEIKFPFSYPMDLFDAVMSGHA